MTKTTAVPTSNEEVFREYFPLVKWHVARFGIANSEVEDYAMKLMEKFIDKNVLADFDPNFTSDTKTAANFTTFLSGFCVSYLRHFAHRDRIRQKRSSLSTDMTVGESGDQPILDYLGVVDNGNTDEVELYVSLDRIRALLPARRRLFFDMVILQFQEHGKVDTAELAGLFGVTRASIHNWLRDIRPYFNEVFER